MHCWIKRSAFKTNSSTKNQEKSRKSMKKQEKVPNLNENGSFFAVFVIGFSMGTCEGVGLKMYFNNA